ncbi:class I SAM-dependent methyltransferase [Necropsobacter massiliensis]|uniref:class I SAM-dependent methyltransferase n=1 Tax=Necropsobacter massiliensis TaxID=1400001 RepID=UPI0005960A5A|nr:class I SAM-dependent methyltransferase [Necropsobacter massiliensis]
MKWNAKSSADFNQPTSWRQLQRGSQYCNALNRYFANWLPNIVGDHLLKIGGLSAEIRCELPQLHQIIVSAEIDENLTALLADDNLSLIQASPLELPFVEDSINACLLLNVLNFCQDPHQILREINRVLCDDGYLFVSLFNPFSRLLFKRTLGVKVQQPFPFRQYLLCRVIDWLELLNFDILAQQHLPLHNERGPFAPLTVICAQKRVYPLTLQPQKMSFRAAGNLEPANAFKQMKEN